MVAWGKIKTWKNDISKQVIKREGCNDVYRGIKHEYSKKRLLFAILRWWIILVKWIHIRTIMFEKRLKLENVELQKIDFGKLFLLLFLDQLQQQILTENSCRLLWALRIPCLLCMTRSGVMICTRGQRGIDWFHHIYDNQ